MGAVANICELRARIGVSDTLESNTLTAKVAPENDGMLITRELNPTVDLPVAADASHGREPCHCKARWER
jgi:hypothetical protein